MNRLSLALSVLAAALAAVSVLLLLENRQLRSELDTAVAVAAPPPPQRPRGPAPAPARQSGQSARAVTSPAAAGAVRSGGRPAPVSAAALRIRESGDGRFMVSDASGAWEREMTAEELGAFRQAMDAALAGASIRRPGGPSWSPGAAAGAPNTAQHGDFPTAWASQLPDGGREWLQLKYDKSVEIREINIHESYNPGALSKVSAVMPDGSERVIWEGTGAPEEGLVERAVKVPPGIRSDQIRIELDTSRVPGWNEIDAVELVGADGSRQWAAEATASSHFGQGMRSGGMSLMPAGDSFLSGDLQGSGAVYR